jgi:ATP-binding cassette subfamily B protein
MSAYALVAYVTSPLAALIGSTRVLQEALIAGERLFEILDTEGESDGGRTFRGAIDGDVHLENVTMRYGSQAPALSNVSMTIKRGSVTAIVGRSGSGKSTVAAILQQLYPIEAGRIRVGELDLADVALQAVRSHMTVVPQHVDLFAGTILENIVPGESVPDLHKVMKACSDAGLTDFLRSLPTGLRTQVGEGGVTLSGGQRQRIAIARALYQDASLLILDEPSSALDASADGILHGIARTARAGGQAMLLITHRAELVELADYVFVLDRGVLVEEGPPGVLMSRRGALWALMTSPIREMPYFSSEAEADPKSRRVRIAGS